MAWTWPPGVEQHRTKVKWTCVLWTLHDHGPFTNDEGRALADLLAVVGRRTSRPAVNPPWNTQNLRDLLHRIEHQAPGLIDRRGGERATDYLGLMPGVELPPSPYAHELTIVGVDDPPAETVELVPAVEPSGNGQGAMSAADALAATASFLDSAMAMAGVTHHEADADERLAEALDEMRRLREANDALGAQLLDARRENDVLQRALARRKETRR